MRWGCTLLHALTVQRCETSQRDEGGGATREPSDPGGARRALQRFILSKQQPTLVRPPAGTSRLTAEQRSVGSHLWACRRFRLSRRRCRQHARRRAWLRRRRCRRRNGVARGAPARQPASGSGRIHNPLTRQPALLVWSDVEPLEQPVEFFCPFPFVCLSCLAMSCASM